MFILLRLFTCYLIVLLRDSKHNTERAICYRPSARLSVRHTGESVKTVEIVIMQLSPHNSTIPLVFLRDKFHPEILTDSP